MSTRAACPPPDAVRIEELVNYFTCAYPDAQGRHPFSITTEISAAPWNESHRLVHIGLQGRRIAARDLPPSNLVFLLDVSGSTDDPMKLPLLKAAFRLLVGSLRVVDRVAIVVYASASGQVLPPTPGNHKEEILAAIDALRAGGSTAGGAGIELAYQIARENFIPGGNNRVILATDGDFNVGVSSDRELVRMIEERREAGVFLTVLGFGTGNYQDAKMQKLADHGNGNHAYIDDLLEAKKVLVTEMGATLHTIAKDAGELGAGHSLAVLYEIIPAGTDEEVPGIDALRYQRTEVSDGAWSSSELLTVKLRYKAPDGNASRLIVHPLRDAHISLASTSEDFRFSAAVAELALLLRRSSFKGDASLEAALSLARGAMDEDAEGDRHAFVRLVEMAQLLANTR